MNTQFRQLHALGAGEFAHLNGSLESHLINTHALLKSWHADEVLQLAGLFHAAYGTDGFKTQLASLTRRFEIANIIGEEAEALVYMYGACDREFVFEQFEYAHSILFKDRFTGETRFLSFYEAHHFCELTVANELEIAMDSSVFKDKNGPALFKLFNHMEPFLSPNASQAYRSTLHAFSTTG